jgi:hypothetical protein
MPEPLEGFAGTVGISRTPAATRSSCVAKYRYTVRRLTPAAAATSP